MILWSKIAFVCQKLERDGATSNVTAHETIMRFMVSGGSNLLSVPIAVGETSINHHTSHHDSGIPLFQYVPHKAVAEVSKIGNL